MGTLGEVWDSVAFATRGTVGTEPGEARTALSALQTNSGSQVTNQSSVCGAGRDLVDTNPDKHSYLNLPQNLGSQGLDL